jgi:DNA primase
MDQVEEIKQKTDIVSIIREYVDLKKAGRNYRALCPFHSEKTPSFMVSGELQIFKCFGCGETGDVIAFLQKHEGMEFYEALKFLADRAGIELKPIRPGQFSEKEKLFKINNLVTRFYHWILTEHNAGKKALKYLTRERGLKISTINKFKLGFSPDASNALEKFLVNKKKFKANDLIRAGLVYQRRRNLSDRFAGRVVFPIFDHRGNAVGFAGRILPDTKTEMGKYINSPETPTYHKSNLFYGLDVAKSEIKTQKEALLMEGEMDVISSWQAGIKNAIAIKGTALTKEQIRLINRFTDKVIFALDADIAGDIAARRGITLAQDTGLEIKVARLDGFKDPDEMARKNPGGLKKAFEEAIGVWDYLIDSVFSRYDKASGEGKAKISREIVPVLESIPDKIVQAHYVEVVARKLDVPTSAVFDQISKVGSKQKRGDSAADIKKPAEKKSRLELLEERFLTLAFQTDPKVLLKNNLDDIISTHLAKRLIEEYKAFVKSNVFDPAKFSESLPKELFKGFSEMLLTDIQDLLDDPDKLKKELGIIRREIKIIRTKEALTKLAQKIKKLEGVKKKDQLEKTKKKFSELSKILVELEENQDEGIIL